MYTHVHVNVCIPAVYGCVLMIFSQIQTSVVYILLLPRVCNGSHCSMHCGDEYYDLPKHLQPKQLRREVTSFVFSNWYGSKAVKLVSWRGNILVATAMYLLRPHGKSGAVLHWSYWRLTQNTIPMDQMSASVWQCWTSTELQPVLMVSHSICCLHLWDELLYL